MVLALAQGMAVGAAQCIRTSCICKALVFVFASTKAACSCSLSSAAAASTCRSMQDYLQAPCLLSALAIAKCLSCADLSRAWCLNGACSTDAAQCNGSGAAHFTCCMALVHSSTSSATKFACAWRSLAASFSWPSNCCASPLVDKARSSSVRSCNQKRAAVPRRRS